MITLRMFVGAVLFKTFNRNNRKRKLQVNTKNTGKSSIIMY